MADTRISFSIDGLQGVHSDFQKLIEDGRELERVFAGAGKEIINALDEQIQKLKERNDLLTVNPHSNNFDPGTPPGGRENNGNPPGTPPTNTDDVFNPGGEDNNPYYRDVVNNLTSIVSILRDGGVVISPESIAQLLGQAPIEAGGGSNAGPRGSSSQGREQEGGMEKFMKTFALSNLIQAINAKDPLQAGLGIASNTGSALMMAGGKAGFAGFLLTAVSSIVGAQLQAYEEVAPEAARSSRLLGGNYMNYIPGNAYSGLGYKKEEVLERQNNLSRSLGYRPTSGNLTSMLQLERGYDVSSQDLLGLARLGRTNSNFDLGQTFRSLVGGLRVGGADEDRVNLLIPDYLKILSDLGQKQVELLGSVDVNTNNAVLAAFSSMDTLKNPDTLKGVLNSVFDNLTQASTPQVEALQFQALARANPGASLWEMEKTRENPFSNTQYLTNYLQSIKDMSVNNEDGSRMVWQTLFGGQSGRRSIAEELFNSFGTGEFQSVLQRAMNPDIADLGGMNKNLQDSVSDFDKLAAMWQETKIGENVEAIRKTLDMVYTAIETVRNVGDAFEGDTPNGTFNLGANLGKKTSKAIFGHEDGLLGALRRLQ